MKEKPYFSAKKRISVRKRLGHKREKCLKRDHYAFCKVHIVKGKGKKQLDSETLFSVILCKLFSKERD